MDHMLRSMPWFPLSKMSGRKSLSDCYYLLSPPSPALAPRGHGTTLFGGTGLRNGRADWWGRLVGHDGGWMGGWVV